MYKDCCRLIHTWETWKKSSIHSVCPWGKVRVKVLSPNPHLLRQQSSYNGIIINCFCCVKPHICDHMIPRLRPPYTHLWETWKKFSIHSVCPWGQVRVKVLSPNPQLLHLGQLLAKPSGVVPNKNTKAFKLSTRK